jgi:hypothetical protein
MRNRVMEGCKEGAAGGHHPSCLCGAWCTPHRHHQSLGEIRLYDTRARRHAGGRQRVTTPFQGRFMVVQAHRTRFSMATSLRNDLANAAGFRVAMQTIRRRLHEGTLRS